MGRSDGQRLEIVDVERVMKVEMDFYNRHIGRANVCKIVEFNAAENRYRTLLIYRSIHTIHEVFIVYTGAKKNTIL